MRGEETDVDKTSVSTLGAAPDWNAANTMYQERRGSGHV